MSRSTKKSLSQTVVAAGTTGMPSPVRKILGTRMVATLVVIAVPLLLASGLVKVNFDNGIPRFTINQPRAAEVKKDVAEKLHDYQSEMGEDQSGGALGIAMPFGSKAPQNGLGFGDDRQRADGLSARVARGIEGLTDSVEAQQGQGSGFSLPISDQETTAGRASGPISNLKNRFEGHR